MPDIKDYIQSRPLLFDGAMQTLLASKVKELPSPSELLNIENSELIKEVHKEYVDAGAKALKTHTFGLSALFENEDPNAKVLLKAAVENAKNAAEDKAFVFADIGPAQSKALEVYQKQADLFLENGITNFLFETQESLEGILETAKYIKEKNPDVFILASFSAGEDGLTKAGIPVKELLLLCDAAAEIDACGLNCRLGPYHLKRLAQSLPALTKPLSLMPNAGYPAVLGRKVVYDASPEYFGLQSASLARLGASILGGCCGTGPDHIRALFKELVHTPVLKKESEKEAGKPAHSLLEQPPFPVAVELQPPADDNLAPFLENAKKIRDAGADWITLADCPVGRSRSDSALMSVLLQQQLGITPLPHLTCRDRNLNATKALLLGLSMAKVHQILLVTGDPIPAEDRDEVKSVYNFNSRKLIRFVETLNQDVLQTPFAIYAALNLNVPNFDKQLELAKEKEAAGAIGFLTQPVLSRQGLENLKRAKKELKGKIIGGIFPVISERNAQYLHHEVHGIEVCQEIRDAYKGLDRERAQQLAVELSKTILETMRPYVDGYYLITPFTRTGLMVPIIEHARELAAKPDTCAPWSSVEEICHTVIAKQES
jgi:homocysteine S-methyltransferase